MDVETSNAPGVCGQRALGHLRNAVAARIMGHRMAQLGKGGVRRFVECGERTLKGGGGELRFSRFLEEIADLLEDQGWLRSWKRLLEFCQAALCSKHMAAVVDAAGKLRDPV